MQTNHHVISPNLIKAYRQAIYVIYNNGEEITLRIGEVNPQLVLFMKQRQVTTAAFLTAYNPYSQEVRLQDNQTAQEHLIADLHSHSIAILNGEGQDLNGVWSPEPSVLGLGISLQEAEVLADRYGQNAFVWVGSIDGFVSLRLRYPIAIPNSAEVNQWISHLPMHLQGYANAIPTSDLAWLMTVPDFELEHWLDPKQWNLNIPWPLARPDGSAIGVGTELDRMFKLVAAGVQKYY